MTFPRRNRSLAAAWREIDKIKEQLMSEQESVDALTTAVAQVATDLEADVTSIQAELNKLETEVAAGNPPKLEALKTAIEGLDPKAKALGALVPTPPAP